MNNYLTSSYGNSSSIVYFGLITKAKKESDFCGGYYEESIGY